MYDIDPKSWVFYWFLTCIFVASVAQWEPSAYKVLALLLLPAYLGVLATAVVMFDIIWCYLTRKRDH